MAYTPPSGSAVGLAFADFDPPPGGDVNLEFDTVAANIRQAGGWESSVVETPRIRLNTAFLRPFAIGPPLSRFGALEIRFDTDQDVTVPSIAPTSAVGTPVQISWRQFLSPPGVDRALFPSPQRVRLLGGYTPPAGSNVPLDFLAGPYTPPFGANVPLEFGALGAGRLLGVSLLDQSAYGTPVVTRGAPVVRPTGWLSTQFGNHFVGDNVPDPQFITGVTRGSSTITFGTANVFDAQQEIFPPSLPSTSFGTAGVGYFRRFVSPFQFGPTSTFGTPGVDFRTRTLFPLFIPSGQIGAHTVDFRRVRPQGFESPGLGQPSIDNAIRVARPPSIPPKLTFGNAEVRDRTLRIGPQGIVYNDPSPGNLIFNRNRVLRVVQDFPSGTISNLHLVLNRNRTLGAIGWNATRVADGQEYPYAPSTPWRYALADDLLGLHQSGGHLSNSLNVTEYEQQLPFFRATGWMPEYIFAEGDYLYVLGYRQVGQRGLFRFNRWSGDYVGRIVPRWKVRWNNGTTVSEFDGLWYATGAPLEFVEYEAQFDPAFDPNSRFSGDNFHILRFARYRNGYLYVGLLDFTSDQEAVYPNLWGGLAGNGEILWGADVLMANGIRRIGPFDGSTVYSHQTVEGADRSIYPGQLVFYGTIDGTPDRLWSAPGLESFAPKYTIDWDTLERGANEGLPANFSTRQVPSQSVSAGGWNYYLERVLDPPVTVTLRRRNPTTFVVDPSYARTRLAQNGALYFDGTRLWVIFSPGAGTPAYRYAIDPATGLKTWDPAFDTGRIRVYNESPNLELAGFESSRFGTARVEYRVRTVRPASWQSSFILQWTAVYTTARVLGATGWRNAQAYGLPILVNRNRFITNAWVPPTAVPQAALVARRVRTLGHWFPSTGSVFPLPEVRLNPFPIRPAGWVSGGHAAPEVIERFNRFFPSSIVPRNGRVGEPTILNRNRTLRPVWTAEAEWGRPTVWFRVRRIFPVWTQGSVVARPTVADTDRTIDLSPASSGYVVGNHTVAYTNVTPFITRFLLGVTVPGRPTPPLPQSIFGVPELREPRLFADGFESSEFGGHVVRANSFFPGTAQDGEARFGLPRVIGPQYVLLDGRTEDFLGDIPGRGIDSLAMSPQRITPHTIWARFDVTQQAIDNHRGARWARVDELDKWRDNPTGWRSGLATVSLRNRRVFADSTFFGPGIPSGPIEQFGGARAELKNRRIFPQAWRSSRLGQLHDIPTTPRRITVFEPYAGSDVGAHAFAPPPDPQGTVRPAAIDSLDFGDELRVELKNRRIFPAPFIRAVAPPPNTEPQPGSPPPLERVGPPILRQPQGWLSEAFGEHLVAFRIRSFAPSGWDSLEMEYRLTQRRDRFTVRNAVQPPAGAFPAQAVAPQFASSLTLGWPSVYNLTNLITPDCICPIGVSVPTIAHA